MKKAKLKADKRVWIARGATLVIVAGMLLGAGVVVPKIVDTIAISASDQDFEYRSLEELREVKLPTHTKRFKGKEYTCVEEEDLLQLSREYKYAIRDYYKAHGASDLANPDTGEFWPEDIEYIVVAVAFAESSYRTDYINEKNCGGLTGINKEALLTTLDGWANNTTIWGKNIPYINCNPSKVDMTDASTCIEYTYHNFAYMLANRLKKDKTFVLDGTEQCIWKHIKFSGKTQQKLLIASNLWGVGNITSAGLGKHPEGNTVKGYINSKYVAKVQAKKEELIRKYENDFTFGQ